VVLNATDAQPSVAKLPIIMGGGYKASTLLTYEGNIEQLDVYTLSSSLLSFSYALQELNKEFNPSTPLNIYIKGTKQGSFIVDLNLILDTAQKIKALFGDSPVPPGYIVVGLLTILLIKISLKGEKPKEIKEENGKVIIINGNNNRIILDSSLYRVITQNSKIDKHIKDLADVLEENTEITGLRIKTSEKEEFISKEDLPYLRKPNPLLERKERKVFYENQIIVPIKIVFKPNRKWEFFWNGEKISALITDKDFFRKLTDFKFTAETKMIVDLEIIQVYDPETELWINEDYFITKVHKVLSYDQGKLF